MKRISPACTWTLRRAAYHDHYEDMEAARVELARMLGKRKHYRLAWLVLVCSVEWGLDEHCPARRVKLPG